MTEGPVFELEIERVRTRYQARVRRPAARPGRRRSFSLPSDNVIGLALNSIHRHLKTDVLPRQDVSPKEFGRQLFVSVFTGPLLTAWRVATAQTDVLLRLRLDNDSHLLRVPWELLFDSEAGTFIATEMRVTRSLDLPEGRLLKVPPPLRILVVLSSPPTVDPLDTEREWAALDEALGEKVELKVVPPRLDEIDRALKVGEWHILHFVGHGGTDDEGGFLILEDQHGEARHVDHLRLGKFLSHPSLRLVVLNACEGGLTNVADAFSGVAQVLLKGRVPAVLAMQQTVSDRAAISFAKHFYEALGRSLTIGSSVLEARQALYRDDEPEWAVPVLYMSIPDDSLIDPVTTKEEGERKRPIMGAAIAALLLVILIWLLSRSQPPDPKICEAVRGAEDNPKECPSPEGLDMAFVRIDPGAFIMGRSGGSKDDEPEHLVTISRPFCIGVYEVTREQWDLVADVSRPAPQDRCLPKGGVKYGEAQEFIRLLNEKDPVRPYRLPTEAEWEYVARGKRLVTLLDDSAVLIRNANCREGDGYEGVTQVGRFPPNPWGVYDMQGNVFEWVADWCEPYEAGKIEDRRGPKKGDRRIRRGGSWSSSTEACSATARSAVKGNRKDKETGFRIVREIR